MRRLLLVVLVFCTGCAATVPDPGGTGDHGPQAGVSEPEDANKAIAAAVSGHDVWLARLDRGAQWSVSSLRNITTRQGYDNQPAFTANGSGIYYTSIRDGVQADVHLFEEAIGAGFRFTSTPQSEFSPMALPAGKGISVVRVEADGRQGLWRYAGNRADQLIDNLDTVGYYTWLDAQTVAMFLVTEPPSLALASIADGQLSNIDVQPGRTLAVIPGTAALSFVDKSIEGAWWISRYDRASGEIERIAPTLEDSEDFAWTPDGQLLMSKGKKIYIWREQWEIALDFEGKIPGDISRLRVHPLGTQLVFVAAEGGR